MAKHVFSISRWGSLSHEGEFLRETASFVVFASKYGCGELKRCKGGMVYIETDKPDAILLAYFNAFRSHSQNVKDHRAALVNAEREQWNAARQAIGLEPV